MSVFLQHLYQLSSSGLSEQVASFLVYMEITTQIPIRDVTKLVIPIKAKYCLYARKSTEQDELQALSIDSQD